MWALVLHLANRFGAPFVAISANAPPALACYAERSAAMAAAFGGAAGTIAFLVAQGAGLGAVVASFVAAVPIGTALAAGVTLGEWSSWKVRRRRLQGSSP